MEQPEDDNGRIPFAEAMEEKEKTAESTGKKTRTRTGCLNCRRRRRKCDEHRPECLNCKSRQEECEWGVKLIFKEGNASSLGLEHPSMQEGSRKRPRRFEILDVTSQIEKGYINEFSIPEAPVPADLSTSPSYYTPDSIALSHSGSLSRLSHRKSLSTVETSPGSSSSPLHSYSDEAALTPQSISEGNALARISSRRSTIPTEDAAADLLSLRYMSTQRPLIETRSSALDKDIVMDDPIPDPELIFTDEPIFCPEICDEGDGIFLPGSAYQELHSTLRNHLIYTARSNVPTGYGTPEAHEPDMSYFERVTPRLDTDGSEVRTESGHESVRSSKPPEILPEREYILWRTWIEEVAPWLDKFDNKRHFEYKIPIMARTVPHLKKSVLALCARQIEQKSNSRSLSESLGLYQEAIHLLLPELHSKNTAVIASCVILCVLEMMSCSPKEWRRHLEGCAHLIAAVGISST